MVASLALLSASARLTGESRAIRVFTAGSSCAMPTREEIDRFYTQNYDE